MLRFEMEAPIVTESKEEIVQALRDIADQIEEGIERGFIPEECQCQEWTIGEEDVIEDDYSFEDNDEEYYDEVKSDDEYGYY